MRLIRSAVHGRPMTRDDRGVYRMSWADYQEAVCRIFETVSEKCPVDDMVVCAIPRGGYVLGTHLSNLFESDMVSLPESALVGRKRIGGRGRHLLICDDIVDTGAVYEKITAYCRAIDCRYTVAAVASRTEAPDIIYGRRIQQDTEWVVFPWERRDDGLVVSAKQSSTGGPRELGGAPLYTAVRPGSPRGSG